MGRRLIRRLIDDYGVSEDCAKVANGYFDQVPAEDLARVYGIAPRAVSARFYKVKLALGCRTKAEFLKKLESLERE